MFEVRLFMLMGAGLLAGAAHAGPVEDRSLVHATAIGSEGQALGRVVLEQTGAGVLISVDISGLTEGEHGFHIHQTGICNPGEQFKTAGGHFSPGSHAHGLRDKSGPHAGDMPNQHVSAGGRLRAQVLNGSVTLRTGKNALFDADGSALIIHADADDYVSQPSGAAGRRIGCAVIARPQQ